MSIALTIRLPESLHQEIKNLAKQEGVSINQFLILAAAEKISTLCTVTHLEQEAQLGTRSAFDAFLAAVPDVDPLPDDVLS